MSYSCFVVFPLHSLITCNRYYINFYFYDVLKPFFQKISTFIALIFLCFQVFLKYTIVIEDDVLVAPNKQYFLNHAIHQLNLNLIFKYINLIVFYFLGNPCKFTDSFRLLQKPFLFF